MRKLWPSAIVVAILAASGIAIVACRTFENEPRVAVVIRVPAPPSPSSKSLMDDYERARHLTAKVSGLTVSGGPAIPLFGERQVTHGGRTVTDTFVTSALVRGEISRADLQKLPPELRENIIEDVQIEVSPPHRRSLATPTFADVRRRLHVADLAKNGMTGQGVFIGIVDGGFSVKRIREQFNCAHPAPSCVAFSTEFSDNTGEPSITPGDNGRDRGFNHGTMVAFDALIAARNATLFDIILAGRGKAHLVAAIAAYSKLENTLRRKKARGERIPPMVLVNSWSVKKPAFDDPTGTYIGNAAHEMAAAIERLTDLGVDVVFSAGNCGPQADEGTCGDANDRAKNGSIYGANSYPTVVTVGAIDLKNVLLPYSSQGPGRIDTKKPDVVSYSQFEGSSVYGPDTGTSAAAPVVAGLIAAYRERLPFKKGESSTTTAMMRDRIIRAVGDCFPPGSRGKHTKEMGYGIVSGACLVKEAQGLPPFTRTFTPPSESRLARR
jgi:hypothetical protein